MRELVKYHLIIFFHFVSFSQESVFSLIDSEKTGITFSNDLVDTKEHNVFLYANYYGGAGVGVGCDSGSLMPPPPPKAVKITVIKTTESFFI